MRSVKFILAAGAASMVSTAVIAADMPIAAPPAMYAPAPPPEDFGGWYLRGDIGMTNTAGKLHYRDMDTFAASNTQLLRGGNEFSGGMSYGLGVGYQFNNWFRADITGEYRSKVNYNAVDFITYNPGGPLSDTYNGGYKSWVGLVNAYVDLGTWWCITPFIGAGVGGSYNKISGFRDDGVSYSPGLNNSVAYFADNGKWNLAWAAHAGLAYKVNPGFTVELAYSYMNLGDGAPGNYRLFDNSASGPTSIKVKDITSHDVKLGVRWELNSPQPAYMPPLVTKG
jgi:opacity protein-like surface antigen